ncbi:PD-(D/E)XK nuclease family protein [Methanoregula sp. UBA64]|jgi:ATP-dependent helicase/nuclease subunit B|uniref:PD-(D/E)XK nuclease family protein n=1 Tax=Methanoregula sp. UBA64 TaxID=1915554 RepID=UPI0025F6C71C|nr:PD-(D/E)XK nuclease family protein [Methanoregula sp. UBA64]
MEQIPGPQSVSHEYGLPGEHLDTVIERYLSASKTDPFSTWILVPTRRLAGCIADELARRASPIIPSHICTIEGFCHALFIENRTTERFLQRSEARMLLAQIVEEKRAEVPFFITRDHPAPGTIDDLMTFMNVTLNRNVPFPECLLELQGEKIRQLDTIITAYRDALHERDLADDDTLLPWTIDFLYRTKSSPLGTVFVYGFYEPLPLEEELFGAIRERSFAAHFFIPHGLDRNIFRNGPAVLLSGEPAQQTRQITGLFSETGSLGAPGFFRVQTFPTRYAEIYAVAAEIARLNEEGTPLSDIAVVCPDLRENLALVEEVFAESGIPWNAAVSHTMARSPVIRFLTGITGLAAGGYAREDMVRLIQSPYFRKKRVPGGSVSLNASEVDLVSRYARIDGPRPDWEKALGRLHEQVADPERATNYPGISLPAVERVQEGIRILIAGLETLTGKKNLRDHIRAFDTFLDAWEIPFLSGAPDEGAGEKEKTACTQFRLRVNALATAAWTDAGRIVGPDEFSRLVAAIAEEPDESGLPDLPGVTLLGPRECPHMKFPVVFVCGLTEGTFPRLTTRLPFTNTLENKRMGTRTLSEILREEQYYFIAALLLAKKTLYLSAPLADGEKPLLTSAFFERVRMRTGECPWPVPSGTLSFASRRTAAVRAGAEIRTGRLTAACRLIPAPLAPDDLVERVNMEGYHRQGGCSTPYDGILSGYDPILAILSGRYGADHVWSPTNLELYAGCPFAYFCRRVIGLEALPDVEPDLSAADRGSAIHEVLSTFYRQWRGLGQTKVTPAMLADATDLILRIAQESLDRYNFSSPLWDATRILMLGDKGNGPGYFERFLSCETQEADSPLVPSCFEFSFGMGPGGEAEPGSPAPVELTSPDGTHRMLVRGRIDRIDQAPDGSFLIYDYKSGAQHPKTKDIEEGTALQLPLYLLAYEKITGGRGIAGGYYTIRRDIARSIVLADAAAKDMMISRPRVSADFSGLLHHSLDCSFSYLDGIRGGRFPLPDREACPNSYCEFRRICRFDPYRVLSCNGGVPT